MHRKLAIAFVLAVGSSAMLAREVHVKTPSIWKLNVAQSDFGGMPAPKSSTIRVTSDTNDKLSFRDMRVEPDGKKLEMSYDAPEDGELHAFQGMGGKMSVTPEGKVRWEFPDGSSESEQVVVGPDGKTLTFTGTHRDKDGTEHRFKSVYDRVK